MKIGKFSIGTFAFATGTVAVLTCITLIAAAAVDEGASRSETVVVALAQAYELFRFPVHTLFFQYIHGSVMFFAGLFLNCICYGILVERIAAVYKRTAASPQSK